MFYPEFSGYNRDSSQTIQTLLTALHECLRIGALVPSSVHFLISFAAVLFRCSPYFPELSACDKNPCSLTFPMFVSRNTGDICKVVLLEEKWTTVGRFRQILWGWSDRSYTCEAEHSGAAR